MLKKWGARIVGFIMFLYFIYLCKQFFDYRQLKSYGIELLRNPFWLILITGLYYLSFICKAFAWKMYLKKDIPLMRYLHALFYSLFVNHIAPVKVGDIVRAGMIARENNLSWDLAAHSVAVMRLLDLLSLGLFCSIGILYWRDWDPNDFVVFIAMVALLVIALWRSKGLERVPMIHRHVNLLKTTLISLSGLYMYGLVLMSWLLEAIVVFGVTQSIGNPISILAAIWVNSMTIAGQVFHLTPGGIGTYETVMSFSLYSIGYSMEKAYHVAMISHGFKFIFSYLVGIYILYRTPTVLKEIMSWGMRRKRNEKS
ncbi:lysylphosphatidylglycerol synthase transmembrane domain-containing protein [Ammoniphilus sp. 3BR4]|uniref:lysylphosphatidylglycerol synthase transmembrane domain-containing protein n=1 Tax=Ammoniphilus sp. 3BR4 TaxID=3158265 RepID=UPI00346733E9